jgi:hypothetical protein
MTAADVTARESAWIDAQLADAPEITEEQARLLRRLFDDAPAEAAS